MSLAEEKNAFSRRLKESLRKAGVDHKSSTRVAREFNLRYPGQPVSSQAVRKWLEAASLPSQDKLRSLASWLDVPAQWLRFGDPMTDRRTASLRGSCADAIPLRTFAFDYVP